MPGPTSSAPTPSTRASLQDQLIVSVQGDDSPLRDTAIIVALCRAVLAGSTGTGSRRPPVRAGAVPGAAWVVTNWAVREFGTASLSTPS